MNRKNRALSFAVAIGIVLFVIAFLAAPHSCEGGLELYFWCGVVAITILFVAPQVTHLGKSLFFSVLWGFAFLGFGSVVWVIGFFLANFKIICRLF